jgi:hypothetical protein
MSNDIDAAKLVQAAHKAGWDQAKLEILYGTSALYDLNKRMFPTPFLALTIEDAITEEALEETGADYSRIYKSLRRRLARANISSVYQLVKMTEPQACRVLGSKQTKTFKVVVLLLAKHDLYFGMKLS